METLQTVLHLYSYDTSNPEQAQQYKNLCKDLQGMGLECFETWGGKRTHYETGKAIGDGATVILETEWLFSDQWNTAPMSESHPGWRVHDWCQDYRDLGKQFKRGYWLEQTPAMFEVRRERLVCGYCGKQSTIHSLPIDPRFPAFCMACIDSEYLKAENLFLTRKKPVTGRFRDLLPPLSSEESASLLPVYREAQLHGSTERGKARIAKERLDLEANYKATLENARIEYEGKLWLLDHGIKTKHAIYYSHTGRWCFGWQQPMEGAELSAFLDVASEFPFDYDLKSKH